MMTVTSGKSKVGEGVIVGVGVMEGVRVMVGVRLGVKVGVEEGVSVKVGVCVKVGVWVGVSVGVGNNALATSHPLKDNKRRRKILVGSKVLCFKVILFHSWNDLRDGEVDRESGHGDPGFDGVQAAFHEEVEGNFLRAVEERPSTSHDEE
jgi:hypothetical protein